MVHFTSRFLKLIHFVIFFTLAFAGFSQNYLEQTSYDSHLFEVNKEWANHSDACPEGTISFESDLERIQVHLELVIEHLRKNTPANLSLQQKENRRNLLDALAEYADRKIFPTNSKHSIRTPYFVDDFGVHCAVGQLMHISGYDELVATIKRDHNYDYIVDIETKGMTEWGKKYGFTVEELKWIQPGYSPLNILNSVEEGSNGPINKIHHDELTNRLIIAGEFDSLNLLPCLNIGQYENEQLSCLGDGLEGIINDVKSSALGVVAFGQFEHNGLLYPLALFSGGSWTYYEHPTHNGALAQSGFLSNFYSEIAIETVTGQEIWSFDFSNNTWDRLAKMNGVVLDIISSSTGQIYVGHFDTVVNFSTPIDTIVGINNVVICDNTIGNWFGLGPEICDTVKVVKEINGALYFGGSCSANNDVCMTKYENNTLNTQISITDFTVFAPSLPFTSINDIYATDANHLFIGGNFRHSVGLTHGYHFSQMRLSDNVFWPRARFNGPVKSISFHAGYFFVGGGFNSNAGIQMNHIARTGSPANIEELAVENQIEVYPNPFTNTILLPEIEDEVNFKLINQSGQIIRSAVIIDQKIDGLDDLANGIYYLQLESQSGITSQKLIKQ